MSKPRVAVHAADPLTQLGLESCLDRRPQLEPAALEEADVVLVAVETADATTLDTLRDLPAPERARFVLVVGTGWSVDPSAAVECGVRAVLWRAEANPTALVRTVVRVAAGQAWLPPTVQGRLLDQVAHVQRDVLRPRGLTSSGLSAREIDVLRLVSEGFDLAEIALKLSYSERTIKKIVSSVMARLGLRNRVHAVSYAIRAGLI
ncbi:helix-turn-helix transcriptional regulator [Streptomyces sp. DSM 40750]|uniref:helix-turn-helix transcriptional regulator n=1 Tax=Streptomyces sp. DSM 40750 TaxID=2801030 RepID=UPI00214B6ED7|nr:response regulator transcription factor [Streptomyces sp. DSM 40750]UUU23648.1 response regulator transcription factor [Streptomyces sp. DSM 40750]